jgi:hypothetical protein
MPAAKSPALRDVLDSLIDRLRQLKPTEPDRIEAADIFSNLLYAWQRQEFALRDQRLNEFFRESHRVGNPSQRPHEFYWNEHF